MVRELKIIIILEMSLRLIYLATRIFLRLGIITEYAQNSQFTLTHIGFSATCV